MNRLTVFFVFGWMILLVSCSQGLSVEEKEEMENFEREMVAKNDFFEIHNQKMISLKLSVQQMLQSDNPDSLLVEDLNGFNQKLEEMKLLHSTQLKIWNEKKEMWKRDKEMAMREELSFEEIKSKMDDIGAYMESSDKKQMKWEAELKEIEKKLNKKNN